MDSESKRIESTILSLPAGAKFRRADLHIHSYSSSHDVVDMTMTPQNIVNTAVQEGLAIIAVTDHNEISNVEETIRAAQDLDLLVIPGVELSTPQGHLLCYLPDVDGLQRFYSRLNVVDRNTSNSRCQQSVIECLNLVSEFNGFGILAHVDIQSGYEIEVPGSSPHKFDVICHKALLGIELKHATSDIHYSNLDSDADRARMGKARIERLHLGSRQYLARVLNSDAHSLKALGHNAKMEKRVTRFKMDTLSFGALRLALEDSDARVRIEDLIPASIPHVAGIHLDGGFLSGQSIHFSRNLNCIIGGRGTGKSTTFEAVRCLVGLDHDCKVLDSEVWPDILHLFWRDQAGVLHCLKRHKQDDLLNITAGDDGPTRFEIDCFGQGDAAKISLQAQTNPLALLNYLDRFIDITKDVEAETSVRDNLLSLQTDIEKAQEQVDLIPQLERLLATTKQQLEALQKPDVKELILLQRKLATEKAVQANISNAIAEAKIQVGAKSFKAVAEHIRKTAIVEQLTVGREEFQKILAGTATYEKKVGDAEGQIKLGISELEVIIKDQLTAWRSKETEAQAKIDEKRRELEALNIAFDMSYITKLATDEASHQQNIQRLNTWKPELATLKKRRAAALKQRWLLRERVATLRDAFGRKASSILNESLSDLSVSLKYSRNAFSPEAEEIIIGAMGWRTNQQIRARYLVEKLTTPKLLEAIDKQNSAAISALRTPEGVPVFKSDEAKTIIATLGNRPTQLALERVAVHDLPKLQVTKPNASEVGAKPITRDFSKLSLGQQQSVLLALMLSSESDKPLIIDQPEDNLDGEFIYATLVPVLRRAKERRQVIIVTHNPNVAVLGDAEQIIVLKALNDRGMVASRGSIDSPDTRDAACNILEGAREAFLRRSSMYGLASQVLPA